MENQAARWMSLTGMPELNPKFNVLAVAHDGEQEFIEVTSALSLILMWLFTQVLATKFFCKCSGTFQFFSDYRQTFAS